MLPQIRKQAQFAFRGTRPEHKEELVAEVIANSYSAYARLVERGKEDIAHAVPLSRFAIRQVRSGRRVGGRLNIRDITSYYAQAARGIAVERLDQFDNEEGAWREVLVEAKTAGPAETAAARIDLAEWLKSLARRKRKIAKMLARGEATSAVAHMFGLSAGRVSQLREEFRRSWQHFQGEPAVT
ncbi:MAG TPA: hypothetical protein VHV55_09095 [Pirellulales bacterium]|jgi:hypothetical protein|nr:hypothetical protein [Pirellulales bacterium]